MDRIVDKRASLHRVVASQQQQNKILTVKMAQIQPLANVGLISSMIAHELNNILTPLANYAQLALAHPDDQELAHKALEKIALNCERACKIQQSLLAMVGGSHQHRHSSRLRSLIDEVFACMCRDFRKDNISVTVNIPENVVVDVVPAQLQQVMMNLILNARDAMLPSGGLLTISASDEPETVEIAISDTGKGIAPEHLDSIFEPFFTTKSDELASEGGSGLGLAFCREIISAHDGSISVNSTQNCGATFKIVLPKHSHKH